MSLHGKQARGQALRIPLQPRIESSRTALGLKILGIGEKLLERRADPDDDPSCVAEVSNQKSLPERYVEGRIGLHVHMGIRSHGADPDLYNVCAFFQPIVPVDQLAFREFQFRLGMKEPYWQQHPMLVALPESVDLGESLWAVPSLVRLAPFDKGDSCIADAVEIPVPFMPRRGLPSSAGPGLKSFVRLFTANRPGMVPIRLSTAEIHSLPDEMIQRRTKIVDDLADDDRPSSLRVWLPGGVQAKDVVTSLLILLGAAREGVRIVPKGQNFGIQRLQLSNCPISLREDARENPHAELS